ncbi:MAG: sigma-70 family RNA polymerase sigma factor [Armatimonadetes bacterium]|nr:sigma-70 family RNA polymerase sigma factor [Armatimonadota bacterium]
MAIDTPAIEWVRRAQAGDLRAFEELFQQYQRGIYNTIFQMVRSEADAADLTQEVFVRAYRALPRLNSPEAFTTWLYRIALNLSRNYLRDSGRIRTESLERAFEDEEESASAREIADYSGDPAAHAQTSEVRERVLSAIETLSEDHRIVVTLHHLEGIPVEEIAQIMRCSVGTVKSRLSRARDHLRRKLASFVEG